MSIQSHINNLCKIITYRRQHLNLYTDTVFVHQSIFSGAKPITIFEPQAEYYDLCDILHTLDSQDINTIQLNDLLLLCKEHEPARTLKIISY